MLIEPAVCRTLAGMEPENASKILLNLAKIAANLKRYHALKVESIVVGSRVSVIDGSQRSGDQLVRSVPLLSLTRDSFLEWENPFEGVVRTFCADKGRIYISGERLNDLDVDGPPEFEVFHKGSWVSVSPKNFMVLHTCDNCKIVYAPDEETTVFNYEEFVSLFIEELIDEPKFNLKVLESKQ